MCTVTSEKIEIANSDRAKFERELQVLAESAEQVELEETNYRRLMKEKLAKINAYLQKVHSTLTATH